MRERPIRDSEREMNWRDVPRSGNSDQAKRPERSRGDGRSSRETLTKGKQQPFALATHWVAIIND